MRRLPGQDRIRETGSNLRQVRHSPQSGTLCPRGPRLDGLDARPLRQEPRRMAYRERRSELGRMARFGRHPQVVRHAARGIYPAVVESIDDGGRLSPSGILASGCRRKTLKLLSRSFRGTRCSQGRSTHSPSTRTRVPSHSFPASQNIAPPSKRHNRIKNTIATSDSFFGDCITDGAET